MDLRNINSITRKVLILKQSFIVKWLRICICLLIWSK